MIIDLLINFITFERTDKFMEYVEILSEFFQAIY
jgi:hypothetical protein